MKNRDGLQISRWAEANRDGSIKIDTSAREVQMKNSDGTGTPLLFREGFGADIIRFPAGKGVGNHTHEGDHILIVLSGQGLVEYNGIDVELFPGLCYLIPGNVDHAIKAETDLVLIVVGNNHFPLDSDSRMTPTDR